jgi:hypothetical protein
MNLPELDIVADFSHATLRPPKAVTPRADRRRNVLDVAGSRDARIPFLRFIDIPTERRGVEIESGDREAGRRHW